MDSRLRGNDETIPGQLACPKTSAHAGINPILSAQPPLGFSFVANTTAAVTMDAEQINIISLALADLSERVQDLRGYL